MKRIHAALWPLLDTIRSLPSHIRLPRSGRPGPLPGAEMLDAANELHESSFVVDLHADPLIWARDLTRRSSEGQVDFPRLKEGGFNLQLVGIPTGGPPHGLAFTAFIWWTGWPARARSGYRARAMWQLEMLDRHVQASGGQVVQVRTAGDLDVCDGAGGLGVMTVIEGGQCLEDRIEGLDAFYRLGVRGMSLTHFEPNGLGGATYHPLDRRRGLTPFGRNVVRRMERLGMIVDLAHASEATFFDILEETSGPVMVSHTGVSAVHPLWRNLTDEQIRAVAARGGVIGVIFHRDFLGGDALEDLVRHMEHVAEIGGAECLAFGSDFDGFIRPPEGIDDVTDVPKITAALLARGMSKQDIKGVLGENFRRLFREVWNRRDAGLVEEVLGERQTGH